MFLGFGFLDLYPLVKQRYLQGDHPPELPRSLGDQLNIGAFPYLEACQGQSLRVRRNLAMLKAGEYILLLAEQVVQELVAQYLDNLRWDPPAFVGRLKEHQSAYFPEIPLVKLVQILADTLKSTEMLRFCEYPWECEGFLVAHLALRVASGEKYRDRVFQGVLEHLVTGGRGPPLSTELATQLTHLWQYTSEDFLMSLKGLVLQVENLETPEAPQLAVRLLEKSQFEEVYKWPALCVYGDLPVPARLHIPGKTLVFPGRLVVAHVCVDGQLVHMSPRVWKVLQLFNHQESCLESEHPADVIDELLGHPQVPIIREGGRLSLTSPKRVDLPAGPWFDLRKPSAARSDRLDDTVLQSQIMRKLKAKRLLTLVDLKEFGPQARPQLEQLVSKGFVKPYEQYWVWQD